MLLYYNLCWHKRWEQFENKIQKQDNKILSQYEYLLECICLIELFVLDIWFTTAAKHHSAAASVQIKMLRSSADASFSILNEAGSQCVSTLLNLVGK